MRESGEGGGEERSAMVIERNHTRSALHDASTVSVHLPEHGCVCVGGCGTQRMKKSISICAEMKRNKNIRNEIKAEIDVAASEKN